MACRFIIQLDNSQKHTALGIIKKFGSKHYVLEWSSQSITLRFCGNTSEDVHLLSLGFQRSLEWHLGLGLRGIAAVLAPLCVGLSHKIPIKYFES